MKISIIIPTLNESNNLPLLLSDLSEISEESEILIIDSLSNDKTKAISYIYGCKFYKIYKKNRGLQLNFGAKKAKGNWLLFLHADSRLKLNWSEEIKTILKKESNFIYFFNFKIQKRNYSFKFLELLVNLRCFLFKTPFGDQGLLINKSNFFKQGGFKEIPLMEDIDFIRRIDKKKYLKPLRNSIYTSERKWKKKNFMLQALHNWKLRRKWMNGDSIEAIYSRYYES